MGKKGLFSRIFGNISGNPIPAEPEQAEVEVRPEEHAAEQQSIVLEVPCGGYDIIKVQGALLEVWNHWSGDYLSAGDLHDYRKDDGRPPHG